MILTRSEVIERLLENTPVSIVRYGDGESIILNALSSVQAMDLASNAVLRRQMGYDPTIEQLKAIRVNLIEAYSHCDVIGLPMHKHKTDKHWRAAAGVLKENVPGCTEITCDIDVAYQMLQDDSYNKLLQNRRVLNYISCRDLDAGFHEKWNIRTVNKLLIAPEAKFTSGYEGEVHYPNQFNKVQRWMDVVGAEGNLLFVGAGVIGKIYCNWWRDRGGIAMDVGGVMDCWAGKVTRGPERGLDKEDLTYKL